VAGGKTDASTNIFRIPQGNRKYDPEYPGRVVLEELHNHGRGLNQRLLIKKRLAYQKEVCFSERSLPFRKVTSCSARLAHHA
jgi:hypothetical protein